MRMNSIPPMNCRTQSTFRVVKMQQTDARISINFALILIQFEITFFIRIVCALEYFFILHSQCA
jgi:hypothetical protein